MAASLATAGSAADVAVAGDVVQGIKVFESTPGFSQAGLQLILSALAHCLLMLACVVVGSASLACGLRRRMRAPCTCASRGVLMPCRLQHPEPDLH